jgi:uncharacterized protein with ParB-like and HNH nuclease domain
MISWDKTQFSINHVYGLSNSCRITFQPDFKRRVVWSDSGRVMLIDTVLRNMPIPSFYIIKDIQNDVAFYTVIDGKQRLKAIFDFIHGKFSLKSPRDLRFQSMYFQDLDQIDQEQITNY